MRWLAAALLVASAGCGYRVAGRADLVPKDIRTIAIPAFGNATARYRLTERLPAAITREFLTRTRYRVAPDANEADAILTGAVTNYMSYPTTFDSRTGRAAGVQLSVILQITLQERASGKILYQQPGFEVRNRYEIAIDELAYFEESDAALDRLCADVARTVVSAVLENF